MKNERVAFGGGCFWCTEAVFKMIKGVTKVLPGYAGGKTKNPTYLEVSTDNTGHAEVAYIEYDPRKTSFQDLLTIFFSCHNPTTLNRQGNDIGTRYRSVIFYSTDKQKKESLDFIKNINNSSADGDSVITEVAPLKNFYEAENYHKDYFENHKENPYCQLIINPKLERIQKKFGGLLKA